jgi:protein tyrosine phosphatase (PTP) superfamily phosphohydrolase (DUF442 family)
VIRHLLIAAAASGVLAAVGCRQCCRLNDPARRPAPFRPPAPGSNILLPPTNVPTTPTPPPAPGGVDPLLPPVGPGASSGFPPPSLPPLSPAPKPPAGRPPQELLLPEDPPGAGSARSAAPTAEPPAAATGLPGLVQVKDGLASGRKPTLEGFDALKRAGYRTVIQLHPAGADVSAAKGVAEGRGLAFVAIEVTPENLADAVGRFNAAVGDKAGRPAYVFDDDGVRAGAVWYLHFRTADAMNDDAARVRARPLGLTDQGDEAKAFALATQRFLETR